MGIVGLSQCNKTTCIKSSPVPSSQFECMFFAVYIWLSSAGANGFQAHVCVVTLAADMDLCANEPTDQKEFAHV